jgi:hypothetical protein
MLTVRPRVEDLALHDRGFRLQHHHVAGRVAHVHGQPHWSGPTTNVAAIRHRLRSEEIGDQVRPWAEQWPDGGETEHGHEEVIRHGVQQLALRSILVWA